MAEKKKLSAEVALDAANYDTWFRAQVEVGLAAANAGLVCTDAEVEEHFSNLRKSALRSRAADRTSLDKTRHR